MTNPTPAEILHTALTAPLTPPQMLTAWCWTCRTYRTHTHAWSHKSCGTCRATHTVSDTVQTRR